MAHLELQKTVYIDSDYRTSGVHENFTYQLRDVKLYTHVSVLQVSIPKTFYNVQSGQNTFTLTELGVDATITVTPGSYSYRNFASILGALLTAASPNGRTYTITVPTTEPITGKYTITASSGSFTISFPISSYMYKHMGFESVSSNDSTATILVSTNVCSFQDVPSLYICSDLIASHVQEINSNVLEAVFCGQTPEFGVLTWNNTAPELTAKEIRGSSDLRKFWLMDVDQNILSTNGVSWNMVICLYSVNHGLSTMENYFKLKIIEDQAAQDKLQSDGVGTEKKDG